MKYSSFLLAQIAVLVWQHHQETFVIPLFLAFNLTITNNVAATKITRRNTMHKNTRSILGNPSQQGKKTQPNPLLYSSRERPSPPRKPSTQEGACKP
jgi:hypothetical protein